MLRLYGGACRRIARRRLPVYPRQRPLTTLGGPPLPVSPFELAQEAIVTVHTQTGLPWWLSIAGTAVALRMALLPTVWYQLREIRRFTALRPQLVALRNECASIESGYTRTRTLLAGMYRTCRRAGVQPLALLAVPLVQIPLLICLLLSTRRFVQPT